MGDEEERGDHLESRGETVNLDQMVKLETRVLQVCQGSTEFQVTSVTLESLVFPDHLAAKVKLERPGLVVKGEHLDLLVVPGTEDSLDRGERGVRTENRAT